MFKIYDGRSEFYQWDLDRKVIIEDESVNQVHFCNRTDNCSLVTEVYELDGLRVADVPNVLLQNDWRINVYAYDKNYTKHCEVYEVVRRSKPADYIYTETEVFQYEKLVERMDGIDATIEDRVHDYLAENPPTADLTGYATEKYVDDAIAAIDIPETDLTGYATEQYVNEQIGKIDIPEADLSNYYNKAETNKAISDAVGAIDIPETDLSDYYTKSEVDEKIENIEVSGEVIDEVYVGTTQPTVSTVKIWVNPDEQATVFATKAYVDQVFASIIDGEEVSY